MVPPPPASTLFPYTTLFRSVRDQPCEALGGSESVFHRRNASGDDQCAGAFHRCGSRGFRAFASQGRCPGRSEEHTSELQSLTNLVCRLLLEKKKHKPAMIDT